MIIEENEFGIFLDFVSRSKKACWILYLKTTILKFKKGTRLHKHFQMQAKFFFH